MSVLSNIRPVSDSARRAQVERLVTEHLDLVRRIARRYKVPGLDQDDLVAIGNVGLVRAAQEFDERRGHQFSTLATWWIRGAIIEAIKEQSRLIRLPDSVWKGMKRLDMAERELFLILGREPSLPELAERIALPVEEVRDLLQLRQDVRSLSEPIGGMHDGEGDAQCLGDLLEAPDVTQQQAAAISVQRLLRYLSRDERRVIACRYQIGDAGEYPVEDLPIAFTEVARRLGLGVDKVKAIESRAFTKLRFWALRGKIQGAGNQPRTSQNGGMSKPLFGSRKPYTLPVNGTQPGPQVPALPTGTLAAP